MQDEFIGVGTWGLNLQNHPPVFVSEGVPECMCLHMLYASSVSYSLHRGGTRGGLEGAIAPHWSHQGRARGGYSPPLEPPGEG